MTLIKSISGIRGTIGGAQGDNLTPIDVVKFTTAYARFISEKNGGKRLTIVVGRDARISGIQELSGPDNVLQNKALSDFCRRLPSYSNDRRMRVLCNF